MLVLHVRLASATDESRDMRKPNSCDAVHDILLKYPEFSMMVNFSWLAGGISWETMLGANQVTSLPPRTPSECIGYTAAGSSEMAQPRYSPVSWQCRDLLGIRLFDDYLRHDLINQRLSQAQYITSTTYFVVVFISFYYIFLVISLGSGSGRPQSGSN